VQAGVSVAAGGGDGGRRWLARRPLIGVAAMLGVCLPTLSCMGIVRSAAGGRKMSPMLTHLSTCNRCQWHALKDHSRCHFIAIRCTVPPSTRVQR
jgi:hypothetical protein